MIKIYSTITCPYCITLKAFLKERKLDFEEIDVSQDEEAQKEMIKKSGQMGVPVIDIDGQIVIGFDRKKIMQLLNIQD